MKSTFRYLLLPLSILLATISYSAAAPAVDVTVSDASGKLVYKGKTNAKGTFATGKLQPGNYVVQFNGTQLKGTYAIVSSAGKKKVTADSVAGEKFAKGGVAMKVEVAAGTPITGQVAEAGAMTTANGTKVKVVNGRRYYFVTGGTGSNIGGHWVEEGSAEAQNIVRGDANALRSIQEHADTHQEGFPGGR
jgi:hypothetical protein